MEIMANGKSYRLATGVSIEDFLTQCLTDKTGVAVALNMNIIHREKFSTTFLADGDRLDIIRPVAGG